LHLSLEPGAIPPPGLPGHLPGLPIQFIFFLNKGKQTKKEVLLMLNPPPLNLLLLSISLPRRSISGSSEIRRTTTAITLSPSRRFVSLSQSPSILKEQPKVLCLFSVFYFCFVQDFHNQELITIISYN
jgi:hypothetical protein